MDLDAFENEINTGIRNRLKTSTERELEKQCGISKSYINAIKNRKRRASGLTVEALTKLFPRTEIYLTGASETSTSIPGLSEEEQLLVDYFRALSVKGKFEAMAAIGALRAKEPAPPQARALPDGWTLWE